MIYSISFLEIPIKKYFNSKFTTIYKKLLNLTPLIKTSFKTFFNKNTIKMEPEEDFTMDENFGKFWKNFKKNIKIINF